VRHRSIVSYDTDSKSSFTKLYDDIVTRTNALLQKQVTVASINPAVVETEGLSDHEIVALITVMAYGLESGDGISGFDLKKEMHQQGYNDVAVSIAISKLTKKGMIFQEELEDYNGYTYYGYVKTDKGD
ncbi:hypothetical protein ACOI1C_22645, partial [Bacillus sp. DJP31]|uniref:hypothetical protein n=1 Tax=Bacillus sp. DJP31 TaxID=3409789 RepID=UPI003BB64839